jgi:succinoglycan biosynthesis transport protein ExoP
MDLLYFLKVLYRKKWIIIGLSFLAILTTLFLSVNKLSQFTSVAQYSTGFTSERVKLADGTSTLDLYTIDLKFDNVIETIKLPEVLSRISYSLLLNDLANTTKAYTKLSEKEKNKPIYSQVNRETAKNILIQKLANNELLKPKIKMEGYILEYLKLYGYDFKNMLDNLVVNRVARTDYLDISFTSKNADLSAFVVNSIGIEFLNYYKSLSQKRNIENAQSIKDLVKGQQGKVDSLGQLMLSEKVSQGTIDPLSRITSAMEAVNDLESRLADEKGKYNQHLNRYKYLAGRLTELQSEATPANSNDAVVRLVNKRNALVEELNRKGGKDIDVEKQISDLRAEINSKTSGSSAKGKIKEAIAEMTTSMSEEDALTNASKTTIKDYEARISHYMGISNANPGSEVKMKVFQTQLDMENKQLGNLKEISNQIEGLAKDDPTSNFIQTHLGQVATEPNSNRTIIKMGLAGISVFFLTSVFFLFLEIFDSSIKTPGMFYKLTKAQIAGVINKVNLKRTTAATIVQEEVSGRKFIKNNIFKNNIRKLRFELLNSEKKVFLFTSSQSGTGKSTIIEALSTSLTLSKKKVLMVDMNFANNTLTRFFETDAYIQDTINKTNNSFNNQTEIGAETKYQDLYIIGCTEGNTTPLETFTNKDIAAFFSFAKEKYDYILIEAASLNNHADTQELVQYADGVFTIFSADRSLTQVDKDSIKFVTGLKEKYYGVILNKVLNENINI